MTAPFDGFRRFEEQGWTRPGKASDYDDHFAPLTRPFAGRLVALLGIGPKTRVLDVGCGPGDFSAAAAALGARVTGLDFSPAMVAHAASIHSDITFRQGDAEDPGLAPASFDVVMAGFLFHHLARPEVALRAWRTLLTPGGRVGLCNWVFEDRPTRSPQTLFRMALADAGVVPVGLPDGPDLTRYDSPATMVAMFEAAGFTAVEFREAALPAQLSVDQVWDAMVRGSVRMAALVEGQDEPARERVRAALAERVANETQMTLNASFVTGASSPREPGASS